MHVNMALVLKFMANYLFNPAEYAPVPTRDDAADDEFLFRQGPARGLGKIRFHDWRPAYERVRRTSPNVARFLEQAEGLDDAADHRAARRGAADATSTSCSPSASCSRWSSTGS